MTDEQQLAAISALIRKFAAELEVVLDQLMEGLAAIPNAHLVPDDDDEDPRPLPHARH
jgi:hypothetical protein